MTKGLASTIIIFTGGFLAWAIYRHFSGGASITPAEIILICVAAPLAGAVRWLTHDKFREWLLRKASGEKHNREQP